MSVIPKRLWAGVRFEWLTYLALICVQLSIREGVQILPLFFVQPSRLMKPTCSVRTFHHRHLVSAEFAVALYEMGQALALLQFFPRCA